VEEEARFELRYEEGFDLYDPRYISWLECNHPEALPADRYSLVPAPSNSQDGHDTSSLLPHSSSVTPTDPLQFSDETTPSPVFSTPLRSDCLDLQDLWRLCHHLQFLPHLHPKFLPLSEVICLDHQDLRTLCSHLWFLPPRVTISLGPLEALVLHPHQWFPPLGHQDLLLHQVRN